MNKITYKFANTDNKKSEEQLVQMCLDELHAVGLKFPRGMTPGDKRVLLKKDDLKITIRCQAKNTYQFFYRSIVQGSGTTFNSAVFVVE